MLIEVHSADVVQRSALPHTDSPLERIVVVVEVVVMVMTYRVRIVVSLTALQRFQILRGPELSTRNRLRGRRLIERRSFKVLKVVISWSLLNVNRRSTRSASQALRIVWRSVDRFRVAIIHDVMILRPIPRFPPMMMLQLKVRILVVIWHLFGIVHEVIMLLCLLTSVVIVTVVVGTRSHAIRLDRSLEVATTRSQLKILVAILLQIQRIQRKVIVVNRLSSSQRIRM